MGKRKRKKKKEVEKDYDLINQVYGLLLILSSILGIGKFGPVGRVITSFSLFLVGSLYIPLLVVLAIVGVYLIIKKNWPEFFTTKLIGSYLFVFGLLTLMHENFVSENGYNMMNSIQATVNSLVVAMRQIMEVGKLDDILSVGGGLIGGVFSGGFTKLFSFIGMQIVAASLMLLGVLFISGFSIGDFVSNHLSFKKSDSDEEETPANNLSDKDPVIHNSNNQEFDQIKITTIDDLKKKNEAPVEEKTEEVREKNTVNAGYRLPGLDLLKVPKKVDNSLDNAQVTDNVKLLEQVMRDFGITAKVVEVHIGPAVSQYELEVASGTRVNRITSINREIGLALAKKDVRIEAPIPGKRTVGIEFANEKSNPVSFYEIMASEEIQNSPNKLLVPLGKTIMGDIQNCPVNKMPHLLIAGTTGSGKSVCVNGIICSILMRARPDEVKLVMVDPKVVELSVYNGIPHLMCPVVSDPKQAAVALQKTVAEMEKRYHIFSDSKTKNIEGYNEYVDKYNKGKSDNEKLDKMPYIVVIIDELADLMMVAAKSVEDSILRITQKARAAGIHLIVATQRPSTEVITGLIKANIPSRISFAVGSGIDSRTILDQTGAEKLLGKGDMLYLPIGQNSPTRTQGSFITDDEIAKLIDFVSKQQEGDLFDEAFLNLTEEDKEETNNTQLEVDASDSKADLYDQIVELVIREQSASASRLQRKFNIGYNKAASMMDKLEENGIVGPPTGNGKPRQVLVALVPQDESVPNNMEEVTEE